MTHRTIWLRGWRVDVFIDDGYSTDSEKWEVMDMLEAMGTPYKKLERSYDIMFGGLPNKAFTMSAYRHTCIYIGWTTSGREFQDSIVHEIRHLVDNIAEAYGLDNGEAVGYISGDAALLLADDICHYGCEHCHGFL